MLASRMDPNGGVGLVRLAEPSSSGDIAAFQATMAQWVDVGSRVVPPALLVVLEYEYRSLHVAWARELPDLLPKRGTRAIIAVVTAFDEARVILQEASWRVRTWELFAAPHLAGALSELERRQSRSLPTLGELPRRARQQGEKGRPLIHGPRGSSSTGR